VVGPSSALIQQGSIQIAYPLLTPGINVHATPVRLISFSYGILNSACFEQRLRCTARGRKMDPPSCPLPPPPTLEVGASRPEACSTRA
jgi:hypothetical protein